MTTRLWWREPSPGDVLHVARNMRDMDAREILGIHKNLDRDLFAAIVSTRVPSAAVALGFGLDENPFCAVVLLICVSESTPWLGDAALFATDAFSALAPQLIRHVRRAVIPALLDAGVRRVECRALAEYTVTRRFLRACGAIEEAELPDHGPESQEYVLCAWRRSDFLRGGAHVLRSETSRANHRGPGQPGRQCGRRRGGGTA